MPGATRGAFTGSSGAAQPESPGPGAEGLPTCLEGPWVAEHAIGEGELSFQDGVRVDDSNWAT